MISVLSSPVYEWGARNITMNYAVHGEMEQFAAQGMHTAAIAGVIAVGVLLVTTIVRLCYSWREAYPAKK